jgi:hypothetical protein
MKKTVAFVLLATAMMASLHSANAALILTGIIDGPRTGGLPKGIELYASTAIADLADYGLQVSANGADLGFTASELTLPAGPIAAGTYLWVASEAPGFTAYFGFAPTLANSLLNINGDDAVVLWGGLLSTPAVVDVYGNPAVDGTGTPWDHLDSFAYRVSGTGPDGTTWVAANWTVAPVDTLDGQGTSGVNGSNQTTVPFGTYTSAVIPEPASFGLACLGLVGIAAMGRRRAA